MGNLSAGEPLVASIKGLDSEPSLAMLPKENYNSPAVLSPIRMNPSIDKMGLVKIMNITGIVI